MWMKPQISNLYLQGPLEKKSLSMSSNLSSTFLSLSHQGNDSFSAKQRGTGK